MLKPQAENIGGSQGGRGRGLFRGGVYQSEGSAVKGLMLCKGWLVRNSLEGKIGNIRQRESRNLGGGAGGGLERESAMGFLSCLTLSVQHNRMWQIPHSGDSLEGTK